MATITTIDETSQLDEAETLQRSALERSMRALGERHPVTAVMFYNLAHHYLEKGNLEKAESLVNNSFAIASQVLKGDHPDIVAILDLLASCKYERGLLKESYWADIVVFDLERVDCGSTYTRWDLPAGAGRLYADAQGIEHVFVNGKEIIRQNEFTGALPGKVLRSGTDTRTVAMPGDYS